LHNPVKNQKVKNFHVPRPARKRSLRQPRRSRGDAAAGGMPGAFRSGIVKNQQRADPEPLHTKAG
jgi:hypothetical protein